MQQYFCKMFLAILYFFHHHVSSGASEYCKVCVHDIYSLVSLKWPVLCVGRKQQLFDVCVILLTCQQSKDLFTLRHTHTHNIFSRLLGVLLEVAHTHTHTHTHTFCLPVLARTCMFYTEVMMFLSPNPHTILFALYFKSLFIMFINQFSSWGLDALKIVADLLLQSLRAQFWNAVF